jgi:hypothetical protein
MRTLQIASISSLSFRRQSVDAYQTGDDPTQPLRLPPEANPAGG